MTITLPSGRKIRSESQRRFVLIVDSQTRDPWIQRRSDNVAKLRDERARNWGSTGVIIDQTTGEEV